VGTCTPRVQAKTTTVGFHGLTLISIAEWVEGEKKSNVITTIGADKSVYILPWCPSGPNAKMIKTKKNPSARRVVWKETSDSKPLSIPSRVNIDQMDQTIMTPHPHRLLPLTLHPLRPHTRSYPHPSLRNRQTSIIQPQRIQVATTYFPVFDLSVTYGKLSPFTTKFEAVPS